MQSHRPASGLSSAPCSCAGSDPLGAAPMLMMNSWEKAISVPPLLHLFQHRQWGKGENQQLCSAVPLISCSVRAGRGRGTPGCEGSSASPRSSVPIANSQQLSGSCCTEMPKPRWVPGAGSRMGLQGSGFLKSQWIFTESTEGTSSAKAFTKCHISPAALNNAVTFLQRP